jgi:hypothetical protein
MSMGNMEFHQISSTVQGLVKIKWLKHDPNTQGDEVPAGHREMVHPNDIPDRNMFFHLLFRS